MAARNVTWIVLNSILQLPSAHLIRIDGETDDGRKFFTLATVSTVLLDDAEIMQEMAQKLADDFLKEQVK